MDGWSPYSTYSVSLACSISCLRGQAINWVRLSELQPNPLYRSLSREVWASLSSQPVRRFWMKPCWWSIFHLMWIEIRWKGVILLRAMAMAVLRAFWNSPVGPKTTHFWGPVANGGFVVAVSILPSPALFQFVLSTDMLSSCSRHSLMLLRFWISRKKKKKKELDTSSPTFSYFFLVLIFQEIRCETAICSKRKEQFWLLLS